MNFNESRYSLFLNIINGSTHQVMEAFEKDNISTELILNKFEWTPLHAAAFKGNIQLVEYLLSKGANKGALNISGYTPQMLAEMNGFHELTRILGKDLGNDGIIIEVETFHV